ncbi:MAG: hypothetical protein GVY30_08475 [Chloroflexi bacterium]|jgi:hypothetical protein|nr:hypothetical protein [Chloroflexota bacterium]
MADPIEWLLNSDEPWTRYRTLVDLLDRPEDDAEVRAARAAMAAHPQVRALIEQAAAWPGFALKRHNDAKHPIYALSTLADFGLRASDPGISAIVEAVMAHQSEEGAFQTKLRLYKRFGGLDGEYWTWMACDAPTLLYALLAFGLTGDEDERVQRAVNHLVGLAEDNGWRCKAAPELGDFKGPGKREDPCPIANVYALKALSQAPELIESPAARAGAEALLWHWGPDCERKVYLFGLGAFFRRLKYPFVWYDILHVVDVLSRFPFVHDDPRFQEMVATLTAQADDAGRYTAASMYRAWKGWSFADKKTPSPWLTFLVRRIQKRVAR